MPTLSVDIPVLTTERLILREPRLADLDAITAFGAEGSAEAVADVMSRRVDHNASPERKVLGCRSSYTEDDAPGRGGNDGKNYDD